jgi:hypothetical protein
MDKLQLVLFVFAFVCFCLSCWQAAQPHWNKLIGAGLAFFTAAFIFGGAMKVFG